MSPDPIDRAINGPTLEEEAVREINSQGSSSELAGLPRATRARDKNCQRMLDPKGGDPAEWPEDLRVREFPK